MSQPDGGRRRRWIQDFSAIMYSLPLPMPHQQSIEPPIHGTASGIIESSETGWETEPLAGLK